jgi:L-lactate dehydrogenase (cytochrome)
MPSPAATQVLSDWQRHPLQPGRMRALALGAKSCMIGRAYIHGLGAFGGPGVAKAIDIIRNELSTTMGLCGVNTIAEIDDHVLAV